MNIRTRFWRRIVPLLVLLSAAAGTWLPEKAAGKTQVIRNLRSFKIGGVSVKAPDLRLATFDFYTRSGGKVIGLLGMDILGPNGTIIDFGQHKLYFYGLQQGDKAVNMGPGTRRGAVFA